MNLHKKLVSGARRNVVTNSLTEIITICWIDSVKKTLRNGSDIVENPRIKIAISLAPLEMHVTLGFAERMTISNFTVDGTVASIYTLRS